MKKLLLSIILIMGGCATERVPEIDQVVYDYNHSTPDQILDFYKTLELSEVTADVMYTEGIREYKLTNLESLDFMHKALNDMDSGYLYKRPEDALYIIYQLKDVNGDTYIMESYVDEPSAVYYSFNEYDLAFKIDADQLFDYVINNADEIIETGYQFNRMEEWFGRRGLIDGVIEEGLVKYAQADHTLSGQELIQNEMFLAELVDEYLFDNKAEIETYINEKIDYPLEVELPDGPFRYHTTEYKFNSDTQGYDKNYTASTYLEYSYFPIAESNGVVTCMRFWTNSIWNRQTLPQMFRDKDNRNSMSGLSIISLMLYHMDEVELVQVNKNDCSSIVIQEANSKYLKTTPITIEDFEEINEESRNYLKLNGEYIGAKLFNEVMYYDFRWGDIAKKYHFIENDQFINLVFFYDNGTKDSFIFSKDTGLTLSDHEINVMLNIDPNTLINQNMNKQNIGVCSGIYEDMMNQGFCYEVIDWSIDSAIEPEYRITTTRYQITDEGQIVLPVMVKQQGVFDHYELLRVDT